MVTAQLPALCLVSRRCYVPDLYRVHAFMAQRSSTAAGLNRPKEGFMRVLIIGAAGMVGRKLTERLAKEGPSWEARD